jgi:tetratricopeptide (TPR) repeat protein
MTLRTALAASAVALVLAHTAAHADGGGAPSMPPSAPSSTFDASQQQSPEERAAADKRHAEELYAQAYREVDKAKQELSDADSLRALAAGNKDAAKKADERASSARKRLEKSRDKFDQVTVLDPQNADGWNMLGFTKRKTGDLDGAFQAYWKCLAIKPEHFGAHEYMGEADLEKANLADAQKELEWLQKHAPAAATEAGHLSVAIDKWTAANPTNAPTHAAVRTAEQSVPVVRDSTAK